MDKKKKRFLNKVTFLRLSALVLAVAMGYASIGIFSLTAQSSEDKQITHIASTPLDTPIKTQPIKKQNTQLAQAETVVRQKTVAASSVRAHNSSTQESDETYSVQAVLSPRKSIVVAAPMDGKLQSMAVQDGDEFEKGTVLAEYDCGMDYAKKRELAARARISEKKLSAFKRLYDLKNISELEYVSAVEGYAQDKAILDQVDQKLKLCKIKAPFPGRVSVKKANEHEMVQSGRVLMEIISAEPLNAELLVPSRWLRWLNVGTPVSVFIDESKRHYQAHVVRVYGEVDPVSQSAHIVAQIDSYEEDLLPGMSGKASFSSESAGSFDFGFLGMTLDDSKK